MRHTDQKIMNTLINSCKKTTELIEKRTIVRLSLLEKLQLQMHTYMCNTCNSYLKRSKFLDIALGKLFSHNTPHDKMLLSEDRKSKIVGEIKK